MNLADLLGDVGGSSIADVITDNVVSKINSTVTGALLSTVTVNQSGHLGLFGSGPEFQIHMGSFAIAPVSGNTFSLSYNISLSVAETDDNDLFFDLGRNADQFAIRPTSPSAYFPSFSNAIGLKASAVYGHTYTVVITSPGLAPLTFDITAS